MQIKWVKFYHSADSIVRTLFTETGFFQDDGETHPFADAEDAKNRSTKEVAIFWDNKFAGIGTQPA